MNSTYPEHQPCPDLITCEFSLSRLQRSQIRIKELHISVLRTKYKQANKESIRARLAAKAQEIQHEIEVLEQGLEL